MRKVLEKLLANFICFAFESFLCVLIATDGKTEAKEGIEHKLHETVLCHIGCVTS